MKIFRVEIKSTAEKDLTRRYQQIAEESPVNAITWYLQIIEAVEKLEVLAERCPIAPESQDLAHDIRHLVIGDYRVLYVIDDDIVEVLHIRHARMDRVL